MLTNDHIKAQLMTAEDLGRTLDRLAYQVLELLDPRRVQPSDLALVGMQTRGVYIAQRLAQRIAEVESLELQVGALDITMYRDDFRMRISQPAVRETNIPFDITGKHLVLVDDVVYTGRTARSAFDALMDMGRPASIHYLVVVDRGLRELPIRPDMVGRDVPTLPGEEVRVRVQELDQLEGVWLVEREASPHHLSRTERT
ncbi:MAG: bifunctional pyr operon transcriptional regulator/uracil phosphoribosyltransferase PyrR [Bacteroidetes bacterium]|jgi:pyrimidine operon attenuation protein/uracil phosphoribosyltransferase|nr:bifunctional pyr operon transcriptional regulator/uracil phosphoribosyltransferase PyrR [Bacteroidota bacterium]